MWDINQSELSKAGVSIDIKHALARLTNHLQVQHASVAPYFDSNKALFVARAPGRLDVMGGIADYSGSTVLQFPLAESAVVFCQHTTEPVVRVVSAFDESGHDYRSVSLALSDFFDSTTGHPASLSQMQKRFHALSKEQHWVAYIAGVFSVLMDATEFSLKSGVVLYVHSTVPQGKGISSSAAIEVATMRVVTRAFDIKVSAHQQAVLCQRVENHVVGAPCGLMDQMTCSVGVKNSLLRLLCQPDIVQEPVQIPSGLAVFGIDSGVRHAVSSSDYESVRVSAFMGYRYMLDSAGIATKNVKASSIVDDRWQGYLANVSVSEFTQHFEAALPETISGTDFLQRYDNTADSVTQVNPHMHYAVRVCTAHPVYEHFRVQLFANLASQCTDHESMVAAALLMGECMYQSHASYSVCGIGCDGTDDLVSRLRQIGAARGIYGARITGGGSGGTVAVLAQVKCEELVRTVASDYAENSGIGGQVFSGSSDGASDLVLSPNQD